MAPRNSRVEELLLMLLALGIVHYKMNVAIKTHLSTSQNGGQKILVIGHFLETMRFL